MIWPLFISSKVVLKGCQCQGAVWQTPRSVLKVHEEWLTSSNDEIDILLRQPLEADGDPVVFDVAIDVGET